MRRAGQAAAALALVGALSAAAAAARGQRSVPGGQGEDPFAPVRGLVGTWTGESHGPSGTGEVTRRYELVLGGKFLHSTTRTVFPGPDGEPLEVHEDLGMLSWDAARGRLVLREFHSEGFVNTYVGAVEEDGRRLVFLTEHVENYTPEGRARYTVVFDDEGLLSEELELAPHGGDWSTCVRGELGFDG